MMFATVKDVKYDDNGTKMIGIVYDDDFIRTKVEDVDRIVNVEPAQLKSLELVKYEKGDNVNAYFDGPKEGYISQNNKGRWYGATITKVVIQGDDEEFPGLRMYQVEYEKDKMVETLFGEYLKTKKKKN